MDKKNNSKMLRGLLLGHIIGKIYILSKFASTTEDALYSTGLFKSFSKAETQHCAKKSFSLRISSVNVTKPAVSCGFGHIN